MSHSHAAAIVLTIAISLTSDRILAQGSLTPPGAPAATMKTLDQIEARTAITNLPYTIDQPGSYYLVGNLSGGTGITVEASNVTIDLNGFALKGQAGSFDTPSGIGIDTMIMDSGPKRNIRVLNGEILGWPGSGVDLSAAQNCQISGLAVSSNGMGGISAGFNASVRDCTVLNCGMDSGIAAGNGSTVRDCTSAQNGNSGIQVDQGCVVERCSVYDNGRGIYGGDGSSVIGCAALLNGSQGIYLSNGGLVEGCTARGNQAQGIEVGDGSSVLNCTARENGNDGIKAGSGCTVRGCTVTDNIWDGIKVYNDSVVADNLCRGNAESAANKAGIQVTFCRRCRIENNHVSGSLIGLRITEDDNYVSGNTVINNIDNYDIVAGNQLNLLLCQIPETIDWPANVKLAGTLTCEQTGVDGIQVKADDVTIDMGGHALIGPGADSGSGIYQTNTLRNLRILNGKVTQWLGDSQGGVYAEGINALIDNIQAYSNRYGIYVGMSAAISACAAFDNDMDGICTGSGATISSCTASRNDAAGITTDQGASISACSVRRNVGAGIYASTSATIANCHAYDNRTIGIHGGAGSAIHGCSAYGNSGPGINAATGSTVSECSAYANTGDGIKVFSRSVVRGCICSSNGMAPGDGAGILVTGGGNRIDGNNASANDRGIDVQDDDNLIIRNTAGNNAGPGSPTANFDFNGNTVTYGPIISTTGPISADPWANFEL